MAIQEMTRVTKPAGHVIITTANRAGLASLLDPIICPLLLPLKLSAKKLFIRLGVRQPAPGMVFHGNRSIDRTLRGRGFVKVKSMTRGFGFSFFRHSVLPEPFGTRVNRSLQRLADRGTPLLRSIGMAYIVLASRAGGDD